MEKIYPKSLKDISVFTRKELTEWDLTGTFVQSAVLSTRGDDTRLRKEQRITEGRNKLFTRTVVSGLSILKGKLMGTQ